MNIINGDCIEVMKTLDDNSIDAIITDPPYGLNFMGKKWDYDVPSQEIWGECLRILKPGGYLLAFAGIRTQHRMAVNIEDAGFEIRDMIAWVYGSGFPKSLNIGKAVDKLQGNEREDLGEHPNPAGSKGNTFPLAQECRITKGTSEWEGWGTAIKPALEPITVARKPLSEKTVAENVLKWGTGGINIDNSRVEITNEKFKDKTLNTKGRFPANFIHDGSDEVVSLFPNGKYNNNEIRSYDDIGSVSRFFYCAKASKSERNKGCENLKLKSAGQCTDRKEGSAGLNSPRAGAGRTSGAKNNHPTVKPIKLMEYLIKLVSRYNYLILDPFMGSGSTGVACKNLNRNFIGIELDKDYYEIAKKRIGV